MKKMVTKIIALVLVLTMSISMFASTASAYSAIAAIVDVVHIMTDLKVTDGPIGGGLTKAALKGAGKLLGCEVDLAIDGIKCLAKAGIGIDDFVDAIHLITDLKVCDAPAICDIADALIKAAKVPAAINRDALIAMLKGFAGSGLCAADLLKVVNTIFDDCDLCKCCNAADFLGLMKVVLGLVDGSMDLASLFAKFGIAIPAVIGGGAAILPIAIDFGALDCAALTNLIKGLLNPSLTLDGLKALVAALLPAGCPIDLGFLSSLLPTIKAGKIDCDFIKNLLAGCGIAGIDCALIKGLLDMLKGGADIVIPSISLPSLDISALLNLLNGLGCKSLDLAGLKALFAKLLPGCKLDDCFLLDLLGKIKAGTIALPDLELIFGMIGLPSFDCNILNGILDFIKAGKTITLPDFAALLGALNINLPQCDLCALIKDLLAKLCKGCDKNDPSTPVDPTDDTDPIEDAAKEIEETVAQDVTPMGDADPEGNVTVADSTPLGALANTDAAAETIANTGDAGLVVCGTVAMIAAAAFVTTAKKRED
ncbi:MAG: hypothetical protein KBS82_02850 [Oscillospiraceae bacterium]|nr:hypothetical protein [Candidatus Limimonas egerieequi]